MLGPGSIWRHCTPPLIVLFPLFRRSEKGPLWLKTRRIERLRGQVLKSAVIVIWLSRDSHMPIIPFIRVWEFFSICCYDFRRVSSMRRWLLVAILALTVPHALSGQKPRTAEVLFCDMVLHPEKYDRKVVSTEALALPGYYSLAFFDPTCRPTEKNNQSTQMVLPDAFTSTSLGKKLSKALRSKHPAKVGVSGVFYGSGGPYGPDVAKFRFVVERIDSVAEAPKSVQ